MAECFTVINVAILSVSVNFLAATSLRSMSDKELQDLREFDRTFRNCWYGRPMGEPDTDLKRPATAVYCTCLYQAREGEEKALPSKFPTGETATFCKLHALLLTKPSQIAAAAAERSQMGTELNNFAAEGHKDVDIQNEILARDIQIQQSSLSWKSSEKLLTFESLKNVELTSEEIRYVANVGGIKENSIVQFKAVGSAFKVKAKVKSHVRGADTIDDRDASNTCDFTVDRVSPVFPWLKPSNIDHARQKIIVAALGGEEAIKTELVKSVCQHFMAALNPALEDLKRNSGKKLTDLSNK